MVSLGAIYTIAYVFLFTISLVLGGDIVHHDDVAPTRPGCENNFVLVPNSFFFLHINCITSSSSKNVFFFVAILILA